MFASFPFPLERVKMDSLVFDTFGEEELEDDLPSSLEELGISSCDGLERLLCYHCKTSRPRRLCRRCRSALLKHVDKCTENRLVSALEIATSPVDQTPCHGQEAAAERLHRLGLTRVQPPLGNTSPPSSSTAHGSPTTRNQSTSSTRIESVETFISNFLFSASITTQTNTQYSSFRPSPSREPRQGRWREQAQQARQPLPFEAPASSRPTRREQIPDSRQQRPSQPTRSSAYWESPIYTSSRTQWQPRPRPRPRPRSQHEAQPPPYTTLPPGPPPYRPSSCSLLTDPPPYSPTPPPLIRICSNPYCIPILHFQHLLPPHFTPSSAPLALSPVSCTHEICVRLYRDRIESLRRQEHGNITCCPDPYYCYLDAAWDDLGLDHPWFVRELEGRRRYGLEVAGYVFGGTDSNNGGIRELLSERVVVLSRREVGSSLLALSTGRVMFGRRMWVVDRISVGIRKRFVRLLTWPWRLLVESIKEVIGMITGENIMMEEEEEEEEQVD
ncbi:hypothetical protein QBC43DRAFT_314500 [Cladorrhinum sp. PSN259]|nr:hypothetical protein QBC43DRAFT_314500 [Cladorrhinum sp. PSN259]